MILVDIFVPSVNTVYDFQLDEDAKISTLVEEIGEMVCQKERCEIVGDMNNFMLCSTDTKQILLPNATLSACGIKTGDSLILL